LEYITMAAREPIYRPEPPPEPQFQSYKQTSVRLNGIYYVMQGDNTVAVYYPFYFRSAKEVVADLLDMIHNGWQADYSDDYVVWCNYRVMAVIHGSINEENQRIAFFSEPRNDPNDGVASNPWPYWPTYDEWVESGRGDLWKTEDEHLLTAEG
jgi:hypothetical protein